MDCEKCMFFRLYTNKESLLDKVGSCKKDEAEPEFNDDKYIHPFRVRGKSLKFCSCYKEKK